MEQLLQIKSFSAINLGDPFFDSLKQDYAEFSEWFRRKADESAIVYEDNNGIVGFLYPKREEGPIDDVQPPMPPKKRFKIGTFKVEAHGTKLGERFLKKVFDYAIYRDIEEIYVTVFPKHEGLIRLFKTYGFQKVAEKHSANGIEHVYARILRVHSNDNLHQYPYFSPAEVNKFLLSIYPEFHTRLFPDSILNNEAYDIVRDITHTNSIHKIYICYMDGAHAIKPNDLLVIYRTSDQPGRARFRSVATSICTVEDIQTRSTFQSIDEYIGYCEANSVFDRNELIKLWHQYPRKPMFIIKMCYNAAFSKRITRGTLIDEIRLDEEQYWGVLQLSDKQFSEICDYGRVSNLVL